MKIYYDENLEIKAKVPWIYKVSTYGFISLLMLVILGSFQIRVIEKVTTNMVRDTIYLKEDIKLNDSTLGVELKKLGCILPNVAIAQFKWETGNFTSNICKENKNIAGIKTSTSEFCLKQNGKVLKNRDHNVYATYRDCLKDYVRIQNRYLKNIDSRYASDPKYIKNIKSVK